MNNTLQKKRLRSALLSLALIATPFSAVFSQVLNGSFETVTPVPAAGSFTSLSAGSTGLSNWGIINTIEVHDATHWNIGCPVGGGQRHVDLNPNGGITQTVAVTGGTTYNFSFWRSVHRGLTPCTSGIAASAIVDITYLTGGTGVPFTATYNLTLADTPWTQINTSFPATATGTVQIRFRGNTTCTGSNGWGGMVVDLVSLTPVQTPLPNCSDTCFWKVTGNNIINGRNILGTLTNDAVRVFTNNTQRGIISSTGNFGWNTTAPTSLLHVNCTSASNISQIRFQGLATNNKGNVMLIDPVTGLVYDSGTPVGGGQNLCGTTNFIPKVTSTTGTMNCSQIYDNGTSVGIGVTSGFNYTSLSGGRLGFTVPPSAGIVKFQVNGVERSLAEIVTSDANYKENINFIPNAMSIVRDLTGHSFTWNNKAKTTLNADNGLHIGFIAQELQQVLPELVITDNNGDLGVNYIEIIPLLTEAIKEQQAQIDALTAALNPPAVNKSAAKSTGYLEQNTPNPFSVSTEIRYQLPEGTHKGVIGVYDMNGKEVSLLDLAVGQASGSVTIKAGDLKPGMYIYTLIVDGKYFDSKKMILTSH